MADPVSPEVECLPKLLSPLNASLYHLQGLRVVYIVSLGWCRAPAVGLCTVDLLGKSDRYHPSQDGNKYWEFHAGAFLRDSV